MRRLRGALLFVGLCVAACSGEARAPIPGPGASSDAPASSTTATSAHPSFRSSIAAVAATDLPSSWRPGCPVGPEDLLAVDASYWGFDERVHEGRVIVAGDHANKLAEVLRDLFDARYPIERMEPVDAYRGDDIASVLANNTSAFNCRYVEGSTRWSEHAYGRALDLNPRVNPWVTAGGRVIPEESAPYADRTLAEPGMIRDGDPAVVAFESRGWTWGGHWRRGHDYQHFSTTGR